MSLISIGRGAAALCLTMGAVGLSTAVAAHAAPAEKTTICHATGTPDDGGNGYVVITPSNAGVFNGHISWTPDGEPVVEEGHEADIIPAFTYTVRGEEMSFPGQNWDAEGQDIFNGGTCDGDGVVDPEPSSTTSEPSSTTSSTSDTSSPTSDPSSPTSDPSSSTSDPSSSTSDTSSSTSDPSSSTSDPSSPTTSHPTSTGHPTSTTTPMPPAATSGPHTPGVVQTDGGPWSGPSPLAPLGALLAAAAVALGYRQRRGLAYTRRH